MAGALAELIMGVTDAVASAGDGLDQSGGGVAVNGFAQHVSAGLQEVMDICGQRRVVFDD
jgi:hypothetical protein